MRVGGAGLAHCCSVPYPSCGDVCLEIKDRASSADRVCGGHGLDKVLGEKATGACWLDLHDYDERCHWFKYHGMRAGK